MPNLVPRRNDSKPKLPASGETQTFSIFGKPRIVNPSVPRVGNGTIWTPQKEGVSAPLGPDRVSETARGSNQVAAFSRVRDRTGEDSSEFQVTFDPFPNRPSGPQQGQDNTDKPNRQPEVEDEQSSDNRMTGIFIALTLVGVFMLMR